MVNGLTGRNIPSTSTPNTDSFSALPSTKPVPTNRFDWNPLMFCLNTETLILPVAHLALTPAS